MKRYKVGISDLGYEEIIEAEDEQEAEEMQCFFDEFDADKSLLSSARLMVGHC